MNMQKLYGIILFFLSTHLLCPANYQSHFSNFLKVVEDFRKGERVLSKDFDSVVQLRLVDVYHRSTSIEYHYTYEEEVAEIRQGNVAIIGGSYFIKILFDEGSKLDVFRDESINFFLKWLIAQDGCADTNVWANRQRWIIHRVDDGYLISSQEHSIGCEIDCKLPDAK